MAATDNHDLADAHERADHTIRSLRASEQLRAGIAAIAAGLEQSSSALEILARSQTGNAAVSQEVDAGMSATTERLDKIAASIASARKDADALAASADATATTIEEIARSIAGV